MKMVIFYAIRVNSINLQTVLIRIQINGLDKKDIQCNIDLQYLHELWNTQKGLCALSGIPMTYYFDSGRVPTNVSVDRINSNLGYIKGNLQLVCMAVNQMKSDLTIEQLKYFCKSILEYK